MKKPLVIIRDWRICTDSPIIYYSLIVLSTLAIDFFIAYIWIPLVQWMHTFM